MRKHALMCEDAIVKNDANKMVDHTTAIARLANRVLQVAKQEADNSEDPIFISDINRAADQVQTGKFLQFVTKIGVNVDFKLCRSNFVFCQLWLPWSRMRKL